MMSYSVCQKRQYNLLNIYKWRTPPWVNRQYFELSVARSWGPGQLTVQSQYTLISSSCSTIRSSNEWHNECKSCGIGALCDPNATKSVARPYTVVFAKLAHGHFALDSLESFIWFGQYHSGTRLLLARREIPVTNGGAIYDGNSIHQCDEKMTRSKTPCSRSIELLYNRRTIYLKISMRLWKALSLT